MCKRIIAAVGVLSLASLVFAQSPPNYYVGEHGDANTSGFLESEFMFATQRWMKLDIERVVTKGTYGPAQDASAWMREPIDLSKVDEVGFADLMPGSGHGAGGYVNVASFEVYGKPVKRH